MGSVETSVGVILSSGIGVASFLDDKNVLLVYEGDDKNDLPMTK